MVRADLADIQGLVVGGYHAEASRHLLVHFPDARAGRSLLHLLRPLLTWGDTFPDWPPGTKWNVGLTFEGLRALGLEPTVLEEFPLEFVEAPDPVAMGDYGSSAPDRWWSGRFETSRIHAALHLHGSVDEVEDATRRVEAMLAEAGVEELFPATGGTRLTCRQLGGHRVHFGFRDGISQPVVAWDDADLAPPRVSFRRFVLGYATSEHPSSPHGSLVKGSSYAAFRWMSQDVAAFNRYLAAEARVLAPALQQSESWCREWLAAKLVGRWRNGSPLSHAPDDPTQAPADENRFDYFDDPAGVRCPISAHARVTNPRGQALSAHVVGPVPRLIRRGMPYGPEMDDRADTDDGIDRGLVGIFICASLRLQFLEIMRWMKKNDFSPVFDGDVRAQDPFANREVPHATRHFTIPRADGQGSHVLGNMPTFVQTRGTAFLLLPGRALVDELIGTG